MRLTLTKHFHRQYRKLPVDAQIEVRHALNKLRDGHGRRKKILSKPGIYECRVTQDLRLLWKIVKIHGDKRIQVRAVVTHDAM